MQQAETHQRRKRNQSLKVSKVIEMIQPILMATIGVCVFLQPSKARTMVAFVFAFSILSHNNYFHSVSDNIDLYYISAGALDLIVILFISAMKESPRLSGDIQNISLVSIMFNGLGWLLSAGNQYVDAYMFLYILLYGWAIITLIRGEPDKDGCFKIDSRLFAVHRNVCGGNLLHTGKKK